MRIRHPLVLLPHLLTNGPTTRACRATRATATAITAARDGEEEEEASRVEDMALLVTARAMEATGTSSTTSSNIGDR